MWTVFWTVLDLARGGHSGGGRVRSWPEADVAKTVDQGCLSRRGEGGFRPKAGIVAIDEPTAGTSLAFACSLVPGALKSSCNKRKPTIRCFVRKSCNRTHGSAYRVA